MAGALKFLGWPNATCGLRATAAGKILIPVFMFCHVMLTSAAAVPSSHKGASRAKCQRSCKLLPCQH